MKHLALDVQTMENKQQEMPLQAAHNKLGYVGQKYIEQTMGQQGIRLTGDLLPCEACLRAKAKAKNTAKSTDHIATKTWRAPVY